QRLRGFCGDRSDRLASLVPARIAEHRASLGAAGALAAVQWPGQRGAGLALAGRRGPHGWRRRLGHCHYRCAGVHAFFLGDGPRRSLQPVSSNPMSTAPTSATPIMTMPVWRQFYALTKPRVIQLIVFCALIGMMLAVPGLPNWAQVQLAVVACFGIWLVAGAAAAFNCVVEQQIDAKMRRTAWRPTAKGQLSNLQTLSFAAILCAAGSFVLYQWVNPLTMWLTFATFVGYAVIYTVILKPLTPQNIVIGGASGAMPPVLGWAAMTGAVAPEALILFLLIFLW